MPIKENTANKQPISNPRNPRKSLQTLYNLRNNFLLPRPPLNILPHPRNPPRSQSLPVPSTGNPNLISQLIIRSKQIRKSPSLEPPVQCLNYLRGHFIA